VERSITVEWTMKLVVSSIQLTESVKQHKLTIVLSLYDSLDNSTLDLVLSIMWSFVEFLRVVFKNSAKMIVV